MKNETFATLIKNLANTIFFFVIKYICNFILLLVILCFFIIGLIGLYHTSIYFLSRVFIFILKFILPAATIFSAIAVIILNNPIHSLLCLIGTFFMVVLFYLTLKAEFLALVFLIVYVGAVAILFLFVIMLLNVKELSGIPKTLGSFRQQVTIFSMLPAAYSFVFVISSAFENFFLLKKISFYNTELKSSLHLNRFVSEQFLDVLFFGQVLYTYYAYLFILVTALLLSSMVGAIVLATNTVSSHVVPRPM